MGKTKNRQLKNNTEPRKVQPEAPWERSKDDNIPESVVNQPSLITTAPVRHCWAEFTIGLFMGLAYGPKVQSPLNEPVTC